MPEKIKLLKIEDADIHSLSQKIEITLQQSDQFGHNLAR